MTDLLAALPGPLLLAVIAIGLAVESGFLIGVAIPGTAIALAAGVAAHTGVISLPAAMMGAALGTISGGQLAYQLGRRRRHRSAPFAGLSRLAMSPWPPLRRGIRQRPIATVLVAQWLASGRLLVPRAAGWALMRHLRFTAAHTPSAIAWTATLTGTGYAATATTRGHVTLAFGLAAIAAVVLGVAALLRRANHGSPSVPESSAPSSTPSRTPTPPRRHRRHHPRRLLVAAAPAIAAAVVTAGCATGPDQTFSDDATLAGVISQLTVRTAGAVHIEPADPGAPVSVHRDIHYRRGDTPPQSVTRREGGQLVLDGTCGDDCLVDYRIQVPRGTPVDASSQAGAITVTRMGPATLRSDAGAITADDISGDLTALTQAGTVDAAGVSGRTTARSHASAVTANRVGGPVDATSQAGPVTVRLTRPADVAARSDASDVTITLPGAEYRIDARDIDQPDIAVASNPAAPHSAIAQTEGGQVRISRS